MIEELRDKKWQEERTKERERQQDIEKQKRALEMQEKRRTSGLANPAYDIYGRVVEIHEMKEFPKLASKCQPTFKATEGEQQKKYKTRHYTKGWKGQNSKKNWEIEFYNSGAIENLSASKMAFQKMYESIVPAAGVTIMEKGKSPKSSGVSIGQKTGRYSKNEMFSSLTGGTMRASTAAPTFPALTSQSMF